MKKIFSFIIVAGLAVSFYACRKNDNPKLPEGINKAVLPKLAQDATGDVLIQEVVDFKTTFTLDLYFKDGVKPKKMDLMVVKNGDFTNVKLLKADITTFPMKQAVTGPQLAQLFGLQPDDITTGTSFEIRPDITLQDGTLLQGFQLGYINGKPVKLSPYGSDATNFPGSKISMIYKKVCPLYSERYLGTGNTITIIDPDFTGMNYSTKLAIQGDTLWTFTNWAGVAGAVVKMKVSKRTYDVTVAQQTYAPSIPGNPDLAPYHNFSVKGAGSIDPCDSTITLNLVNSVTEGEFEPVTLVVKQRGE